MRKLTTTIKALMLLAAFIWPAMGAMAQTVIDFEAADDGYTASATEGSSNVDVFNRVNTGVGTNTSYYWAAEDMNLLTPTLTLDQIDVTGNAGFTFSADLLTPNTNDWDVTDEVLVTYSIDGGPVENLFWIQSNDDGDDFNAPAALDADFDGTGDDGFDLPALVDDFGAGVGSDFETFTSATIPLSGNTTLDITITFVGLEATAEGIYMDNLTIAFGAATPDPEPTNHVLSFAAAEDDASSITVTWADNDGAQAADAFLVKASTGAITPPVDGTEEADAALVANVAHGTETYTFTGLTANTAYNFEIYPYTNTGIDIDFKTDGTVPTATATTMAGGTLDWFNLQWPEAGTITVGGTYDVYAKANEPGVTDAAGQGAGVSVWIGYSTEDTNPNMWTNWIEATYNGDSGNDDEYTAEIGSALDAGIYYYASRFQLNGGDYTYGGFQSGAWDGTTNVSGVLTIKRAAAAVPYTETFDADLGTMLTYNVSGATKEWDHDGTNQAANMNGYNSGDLEEDWMILPAIDLSAKANEEITFDTWYKFGSDDVDNYLKLMYSENYTGVGDPSSATWTELTYAAPAAAETWTTSGAVDLAAINGAEVYIAFKYHYNSGSYRTWKIDNISVAEGTVGEAPVVANVAYTPMYPTSSDAINVSADVTDADGTITAVTLNWGTASGTLSNAINMTVGTVDNYVVDTDIPAQADGTVIYYEIVAEDNDGNLTNSSEMMIEVVDPATATLPYANDFATDLGDMYIFDAEGAQGWYYDAYGGSTYAKISGFSGTQLANVDYMITPAIDFSGVTAIQMSFDEIINFGGTIADQQEVLVSTDYTGTGDPSTATWTELTITNRALGTGWDWFSVDVVDLSAYAGETSVHIAFKYTSTTSEAATWEVDNLVIEETPVVPVIENIVLTPDMILPGDAVSVSADVTDANGTISTVTLNWGTVSGTLGTAINMTVGTGDNYVVDTEIPAQVDGTTVYYEIVAEDNDANVTTTVEMSYDVAAATQVADIATLRAGATDGTVYELTGQAVLTFQMSYNNQKYVEDATGGILIYDAGGAITTTYNRYDGITGLTGTLEENSGVMRFIPTLDPGAATGNGLSVTTPTVLLSDIIGDVDTYESELVTIEGITFLSAGSTFTNGTNYDITDGVDTITFRTNFFNVDYIGTTIPSGIHTITAVVAEYWGSPQVYIRDAADIVSTHPVIANIAITPTDPSSSDVVTVSADVTNEVGALTSVELNWGVVSGTLDNTVTMTTVNDTAYTGDIPAQADGTTVYYEIVAVNDATNTTTTDEMSYDVVDYLVATQLSITSVSPVSPYVNQVFDVEVTALDANSDVGVVSEDTEVQINLSTGTGTIGGVVTGTILNGTSTVTISDLTYDVVETINLNASTVTGMTLTTSADYEVVVADLPDVPLVFISEYIEGSSNNKAIEIYNGTGAELDLTGFSVMKSSNGDGVWGSEEGLTGTLADGGVYVIANAGADAAILGYANVTSTVTYFNGNDAVGLFYNGDLIDVIGIPSEATNWAVAGVADATAEHTLVRKYPDVTMGNTDWETSAGTNTDDSEWVVNAQDDFSFIGWHGTPPTVPIINGVAITPQAPTSTDAVSVSANVIDNDGTITSVTLNWSLVSGTLDNAINMSVSTGDTYVTDTDIPMQADGTTVYYEIVAEDNDAQQTVTSEMSYDVVDITVVQVADIAALRAGATDGTVYELTGEAVITFMQSNRNQKFVQDATGGILIDDNDGIITTTYNRYDGITGLQGTLTEYYGLLQFIPTEDPGAATSTGNAVTPVTVTISDLVGAVADYESELVLLEGLTFADAGGTFATGTNYELSDGTNTINLRTNFYDADYIGTTIPSGPQNIVSLVGNYNGAAQITARETADITPADTDAPIVSNIVIDPAQPTSSDEVNITVTVTDADANLTSVVLMWGTIFQDNEIAMELVDGDTWVTSTPIPVQDNLTTIQFTITATDADSNEGSASSSYTVFNPFTGSLPFIEPFLADLGEMTAIDAIGDESWNWDSYGYAKMSGYAGQPYENEDWLVTPELDFSGVTEVTLNFREAINFAGTIEDEQEVYISTDYDGLGDPTTATWTELAITGRASGTGWSFVDVEEVNLSDYAGEASVYIAFVYKSNTSDAATWEIDDIKVEEGVGIANATVNNVSIYPNPAQNEVFVTGVENISNVQIIGLDGKVVMSEQTNNSRIDVSSINDGMYILRVISGNEVYTTRFVKK